jgi:predicted N-formylglutamate amidohydrolase
MSEHPAYELVGDPESIGSFVFCCEHGGNRVDAPLWPSESDREVLATHWGWDIGARDLTSSLVDLLGGQAVVAAFSRLVIDPNRPPGAATSIVQSVEGTVIDFNRELSPDEIARRHESCFHPYHDAVDRCVDARAQHAEPFHLLSVHSFTPQYLGQTRPMEVGILFREFDHLAFDLEQSLSREGFATALNAPYSGKGPDALIYSVQTHAERVGVPYLELEVRQDLIDTPAKAAEVAERIARGLEAFRPTR